jgi:Flp pilus assembly protein TadG
VEAALLAPLLLFLMVITVDFARCFYCQLAIDDCARNGAHYAMNLRSYQETGWVAPYDAVTNATLAEGNSVNPPVTADQVTVTPGTGSDGNPNVTVSITYPFTMVVHLPGLPNTFNLKAQVSARVAP